MTTDTGSAMDPPAVRPRSVAEAILRAAARGGVQNLWMTTGSDLTSFQEGAAQLRAHDEPTPRVLTAPHEHMGLTAAMGETMVTGRPAMTAVHADLGMLHHGGALHNALVGQYPVLMMSGYPPVTPERRTNAVYWYQQRWDQGATVRQYVQWDYKLSPLDDPAVVTARALQVALSPPLGPVYLAVPDEVARGTAQDGQGRAPTGIPARLGGGAPDQVADIARRLREAKRPLLIVERTGRDPRTVTLLARLAQRHGLAVLARRYRLNLPDGHPWAVMTSALSDADVIIAIEAPIPWIPAASEPGPDCWVAVVGTDPLVADVPLWEFLADALLQADPYEFLAVLEEELDGGAAPHERAGWLAPHRQSPQPPAGSHLSPQLVAAGLNEVLDAEDILTSEVFDTAGVRRTVPGTLFEKGASSLGWAQAAAVGARYASGDRTTMCVTGDGSYLFGAPTSCLWLQGSIDAPVVTVILNNGGYRTGTTTLAAHYPDGAALRARDLSGGLVEPSPPFAAQAVAAGGFGVRVAASDQLVPALREARREVERQRVPAVVEVALPPHRDTVLG